MRAYVSKLKTLFWGLIWKVKRFESVSDLVNSHFTRWSDPNHQNRLGFYIALSNTCTLNPVIVETGTSAYGTDSSRIFDIFAKMFNGYFYSVDINEYPSKRLRITKSKRSKFYIMDSVDFLKKFGPLTEHKTVDLFYLDSWDIDWENPLQSSLHGRNEMDAIKPYIKQGTVLMIDDTPNSLKWIPVENRATAVEFKKEFGVLPGKGAFFAEALAELDFQILHHDYNIVLLFK
jgi:hypothetical protein